MRHNYPDPQEVGFRTPPHLLSARFRAGFQHALEGGQLNKVEYFRLSFREGFRYPAEVQRLLPALEDVKIIPVDWADLTAKDWEEAKAHFRKAFGVD